MGGQASWLLPAALLGLVAVLVARRRAPRTDRVRAAAIIWGGWLLVTGAVFSFGQGIIHTYYTVALAPAIAALVALGAHQLWTERRPPLVPRHGRRRGRRHRRLGLGPARSHPQLEPRPAVGRRRGRLRGRGGPAGRAVVPPGRAPGRRGRRRRRAGRWPAWPVRWPTPPPRSTAPTPAASPPPGPPRRRPWARALPGALLRAAAAATDPLAPALPGRAGATALRSGHGPGGPGRSGPPSGSGGSSSLPSSGVGASVGRRRAGAGSRVAAKPPAARWSGRSRPTPRRTGGWLRSTAPRAQPTSSWPPRVIRSWPSAASTGTEGISRWPPSRPTWRGVTSITTSRVTSGGGPGGGGSSAAITAWVKDHFRAETIGGQTVYDLSSGAATRH